MDEPLTVIEADAIRPAFAEAMENAKRREGASPTSAAAIRAIAANILAVRDEILATLPAHHRMNYPPYDVSDRDRELFRAYHLASRVLEAAYDLDLSKDQADKHWELLRLVAAGETTVTVLEGDLPPGMPEKVREHYTAQAGRTIAEDRELAARIIRGFEEMLSEHGEDVRKLLDDVDPTS